MYSSLQELKQWYGDDKFDCQDCEIYWDYHECVITSLPVVFNTEELDDHPEPQTIITDRLDSADVQCPICRKYIANINVVEPLERVKNL